MKKRRSTEKELILSSRSDLYILESDLVKQKYSLEEIADLIPGTLHVNEINDLSIKFINSNGQKLLDKSQCEVIEGGIELISNMYKPGTLDVFSQPLLQLIEQNDETKSINFFQKIRWRPEMDYEWVFTSSKILKSKKQFISLTQTLNSFSQSACMIKSLLDDNYCIRANYHYLESLTKREKQIIGFIAKGYTNRDIANMLFISIETVKTHRKNIKKKGNFKSIRDIIKFAEIFEL